MMLETRLLLYTRNAVSSMKLGRCYSLELKYQHRKAMPEQHRSVATIIAGCLNDEVLLPRHVTVHPGVKADSGTR
jgi:hypothetical protein